VLNGMAYGSGSNSGGGWSGSIDARGKGGKIFDNLLQSLLVHSLTPTQHLRIVLEATNDFEEAVHQLSTNAQVNENYFIVAGSSAGQGAIITRGREKADDVWRIDSSKPAGWYRLQTNYDHWNPPPKADDRRTPGYALMNAMTPQGLTTSAMWSVITTFPVFNMHTDYSLIAVPARALYNSTVWMG
jgi:N-acylethanolamine-hydrolysing acid amidase